MIQDPDRDGFDPFREEYPAHEAKPVADLLGHVLRPWAQGDPPQPQPKQAKCGLCHKDFIATSAWFAGKWRFSGICLNCADGNTLPPGFLEECKRAPIRQMSCPNCGISRGVEGKLRFNLWQYELQCSHCGYYSTRCCRLRRNCTNCGEEFWVAETWPRSVCSKCHKKKSSTYGDY